MSSQRKIDSARANGVKSHGPVSEAGRKKSSLNALQYGVTARTLILPSEDDTQYNTLRDAYLRDLNPADSIETDLAVAMVNAKWRQRRLYPIEPCMFDRQIESVEEEEQPDSPDNSRALHHLLHLRCLRKAAT